MEVIVMFKYSKIASALNEMKDWKNLHFDGEKILVFQVDLVEQLIDLMIFMFI